MGQSQKIGSKLIQMGTGIRKEFRTDPLKDAQVALQTEHLTLTYPTAAGAFPPSADCLSTTYPGTHKRRGNP